jgi:hypothetical protein
MGALTPRRRVLFIQHQDDCPPVLREAVDADVPVLGICFGAQLRWARTYRLALTQIGIRRVTWPPLGKLRPYSRQNRRKLS